MYPEDCKELMYLIGSDAQIARKNVNPSKAFTDSLSVDMQSVLLYGLVGVVILLACFLVFYGVFYLSVIGRIHQFGQLRTIGMTKKQMKKFVSREGGILFIRSAPVGIVIGGAAGYFKEAQFHITYASSVIELNEYGMSGMQTQTPLDEKQIQEIAALDGVKEITQIKNFGVRFDYPKNDEYDNDDIVYPLTETETKEIGKYVEDGSADFDKLMSGNYILAAGNNNAEEIYGWQFTVGDKLILHYYDGNQMAQKEVTILGILNEQYALEHDGLEGWFLMPERAILDNISYDSLNGHLLVTTEEEKEEAVGESLEAMVAERPELTLETLAERKIVYGQIASQLFGIISGLAIFIMLFSILSMMNTLITNIVTKKQELAMLESIGMDKRQIRNMLCMESLILVIATVGVTMTAGTLCGYILSSVLYRRGAFYMAFRFPAVFAAAYAVVLIFVPLFITFVSLHRFSKEALVERLRGKEN